MIERAYAQGGTYWDTCPHCFDRRDPDVCSGCGDGASLYQGTCPQRETGAR